MAETMRTSALLLVVALCLGCVVLTQVRRTGPVEAGGAHVVPVRECNLLIMNSRDEWQHVDHTGRTSVHEYSPVLYQVH